VHERLDDDEKSDVAITDNLGRQQEYFFLTESARLIIGQWDGINRCWHASDSEYEAYVTHFAEIPPLPHQEAVSADAQTGNARKDEAKS